MSALVVETLFIIYTQSSHNESNNSLVGLSTCKGSLSD